MPAQIITSRIGILACGGIIPSIVAKSCHDAGHDPFIVALKSFTDPTWMKDYDHAWHRIGALGGVIKTFKTHGIRDLCLIGSLGKPSLSSLRPDLTGIKFLSRVRYSNMGDDGLLRAFRTFLEGQGFVIHGAHRLAPDLLTPAGVLGAVTPSAVQEEDIEFGIKAAQKLGERDMGQAVIVLNGQLIAEEAREGTAALIAAHGTAGAILVKLCKPQQDRDIDMPTIGPDTVRAAASKNMGGLVAHAGESLFVERARAISEADTQGLFVLGAKP